MRGNNAIGGLDLLLKLWPILLVIVGGIVWVNVQVAMLQSDLAIHRTMDAGQSQDLKTLQVELRDLENRMTKLEAVAGDRLTTIDEKLDELRSRLSRR